jgi:hypothetical protein
MIMDIFDARHIDFYARRREEEEDQTTANLE